MKLFLPWFPGNKIDPSYSPAIQGAKVSLATVTTVGISIIFTNYNAVNFASMATTLQHQLSTAVSYICKMVVKLTTGMLKEIYSLNLQS